MTVGFIGLGLMGEPIACNLARAGIQLMVWNRTPGRTDDLRALGAQVADSPSEVFTRCEIVLVMLANAEAIDEVLHRGTPEFAALLRDRVLVHLGTTAPAYSAELGRDVVAAGGTYVEAPVSGSRVPAERGELAGMIAGGPEAIARVKPLLGHACTTVVECGPVPAALTTKLAVNIFLITMVTGLTEAFGFAAEQGLDLDRFAQVLDAGPMASPVSRLKLAKLVAHDYGVQAALPDVLTNTVLIKDAATAARIATPLTKTCLDLYAEAHRLTETGAKEDMVAVVRALHARTAELRGTAAS